MARRHKSQSNHMVVVAILLGSLFVGGVMAIGFAVLLMQNRNPAAAAANNVAPAGGGEPQQAAPAAGGGLNIGGLFGARQPYNERIKEKTIPADQAPLDTPVRSHKDHPWVTLVKAEIEKSDGRRMPLPFWQNGETIVLDYESSADFTTHPVMSHGKVCVMLKNEKGEETEWVYRSYDQLKNKGSWVMVDSNGFPGRPPGFPGRFGGGSAEKAFTPNMEIFVILEDSFDRKNVRRFKISNSLTIGDKARVTPARDWSAEEAKQIEESVKTKSGPTPSEAQQAGVAAVNAAAENFGGKPPATAKPSETLGAPGGWKYEFAKDGVPVLGFAYKFGSWDNHPSLGAIRPLFKDVSVNEFPLRIMAKEGYAVGGIKVEVSPFVSGIQVIFMKLDGKRLNPADSYASDWIRAGKEKPEKEASYVSDGKLVIGVHGNNGAIVNTLGLLFQ